MILFLRERKIKCVCEQGLEEGWVCQWEGAEGENH